MRSVNTRAVLAVGVLLSIAWLGVRISFTQHHGSRIFSSQSSNPLTADLQKKVKLPLLHAGNKEVYNVPYWRWLPGTLVDSQNRYYPKPKLTVHPTLIENGGLVTVEWSNVPSHTHSPWMGLYCPANFPSNNFIDYWFIKELSPFSDRGQLNVSLFNIREDCQFRFFLNDSYPELVAKSHTVRFIGGRGAPLHGHLALTGKPDEMRVMWTSGLKATPTVHYGLCDEQLSLSAAGSSSTYSSQEMCGPPANLSFHFRDPGFLHDVLLTHLRPNTLYCYQYGNHGNQFSSVKSFRTALPPGEEKPYQFIAYGDMDLTPAPGAEATRAGVSKDVQNEEMRFILHIGDLGYALGFAYRWEEFMSLIEPIASHVPYMVSVGNHEQNTMVGGSKDPSGVASNGFHPSWGNYGHDSGGECGVPVYHRFHMPGNGHKLWWYSFKYGVVQFVQISTEHNFTRGSRQYSWLEGELRRVDRKETPWVVVSMHRPMYTIDNYHSDGVVAQHLRRELEDLLYLYQVDVVLSGHYHSYERSCKVYRERCVEDGIVHIVVGSAGCHIVDVGTTHKQWSRHFEHSYGYGRMLVASRRALHWEFVRNKDGIVSDRVSLYK